jgi:hypothetical protein
MGLLPLLILVGVGVVVPLLLVCGSWHLARSRQLVGTGVLVAVALFLFALCAWIFASFDVMITEVTPTGVRVWFAYPANHTLVIPADRISAAEVVRYDPMAEYGGWGIRHNLHIPGDHAMNQVGDRGVRIQLNSGVRWLIGSEQPEALHRAIEPFLHDRVPSREP